VALLVRAIRDRGFHDRLDTIVHNHQDDEQALQAELKTEFEAAGFHDINFAALIAVSLDYCDRDTAGYERWKDEKSYNAHARLARAWKEECRWISAHAGGAVV
jgi:hypothetical protein